MPRALVVAGAEFRPAGAECGKQGRDAVGDGAADHVHPTTDTPLKYISPEIQWTLLGIDQRWWKELRVVFRKWPGNTQAA